MISVLRSPACWSLVLCAIGLMVGFATHVPPQRYIGRFSTAEATPDGHPSGWQTVRFGDVETETRYRLVERPVGGDSTAVVRAVSDGGAAGLGRALTLDPQRYPVLSWRWKVTNVLDEGDARTKDGDDYPARLYVTFDYDPSNFGLVDRAKYEALQALGYDQIPTRALNYVWASRVDRDTILPNAFTDWVQMIPVESGSTKVGTWVRERRDIRADYRRAFGGAPPPIDGVAIMTDTDNTGEAATAYYGDIVARLPPSVQDSNLDWSDLND
ncbi:DUF3047 domain-containing protein [Salinibacter ruber]|uniref:DUF3047 domain-containing protein n=1 Tax=Salinibacter ruber TaxID=146919 RepID=UPI0021676B79|nr:DUF3047 domain-containing protein [Salinibacter ruber]